LAKRLAEAGASVALVGLEGRRVAQGRRRVRAERLRLGCRRDPTGAQLTGGPSTASRNATAGSMWVMAKRRHRRRRFHHGPSIRPAFEKVIEVDLLGVWRTVRVCLPHLISARGYLPDRLLDGRCRAHSRQRAVQRGQGGRRGLRQHAARRGTALRRRGRRRPSDLDFHRPRQQRRRAPGVRPAARLDAGAARQDLSAVGRGSTRSRPASPGGRGTIHIPANLLLVKLIRALLPPIVEFLRQPAGAQGGRGRTG